jgi:hypothetical protein
MKRVLKFPALVRGIAPKSGEQRHCLVAGSAEFEIREVDISRMPLAFLADRHEFPDPIEYRMLDGVLYKGEDDYEDFERSLGDNLMADGYSATYQRVADEIIETMTSGKIAAWPKDAHLKRKKGAKDLETSGVVLLPGGQSDLAHWRDKFEQTLGRFVVSAGKVWTRTAEPVFCVGKASRGAAVHLYVDDASLFSEARTEWGTKQSATSAGGGSYRIFSISEHDAAVQCLRAMADELEIPGEELDTIEIIMREAVTSDIDRFELDRLARVCAAHATKAFTKVKPGGGETLLDVAPSSLVSSWLELRDLLRNYSPANGIPDELETRFTAFIAESDGFAAVYGDVLISAQLREAVSYSLDRWENRSIDVGATTRLAAG